jgi:hypothetical protein
MWRWKGVVLSRWVTSAFSYSDRAGQEAFDLYREQRGDE